MSENACLAGIVCLVFAGPSVQVRAAMLGNFLPICTDEVVEVVPFCGGTTSACPALASRLGFLEHLKVSFLHRGTMVKLAVFRSVLTWFTFVDQVVGSGDASMVSWGVLSLVL